ncbi:MULTISPECIES: hypothetical protein [unclassified Halorubrum]|uniref:hypothetical protein n=1 Tax=unclassified Halorubrum TaxID=2642239 RepID=UPI000B98F1C2|nr:MULTISPECIES: hypothetical protein [unclassified Halorubrum]OYR50304.1 hypothetical protein DJ75_00285 [Halorubrum sp. Eb13]OYR52811.1 hypothetical protein DJ73_09730 [Halorubrum sp. Ea1]
MDGKKALYYGAVALAVLIGVSVLVSVVSAILSIAWAVISGVVTLAVLAGLAYVAYKAGSWFLGSDDPTANSDSIGASRSSSSTASGDASESRQDRLRQQYVEGQISEAEFERRIASELETEELDDIDRELERER